MRNDYECVTLKSAESSLDAVRGQELPETVRSWIDTYDDVAGDRDRFLWQWLYHLFPTIELSCVDDDRVRDVRDAKLAVTMFAVVADDVAERRGDRSTFDELTAIPFDRRRPEPDRPGVDGDVVRFLLELWEEFSSSYDASPRSEEFAELLQFDLRQALQAIEYSYLANQRPELVSERELWTYDVYNMLTFVYADIDLANASAFDESELSLLRQVCDRTQRMARIGNWLSTWERELAEGDASSAVAVHALENDVLSADQRAAIGRQPSDETVASIVETIRDSCVEEYFLNRWEAEREEANRLESAIGSVDVEAYLEGFETVLRYQLASEGHK